MTADFVNAYVIGGVGATGANVGACATSYNLRQGMEDIRSADIGWPSSDPAKHR